MEVVVITGSTRGIGLGLATELLKRNRSVIINGRRDDVVQIQLKNLREAFPSAKVEGYACDVTDFDSVQGLWNYAIKKFSKVDIWINNAGVMNDHRHTWEVEPKVLKSIVDINVLGTLYGCKVAIKGMMNQGAGMGLSNLRICHQESMYGTLRLSIRME